LCAVMSCGICSSSPTREAADEMLIAVCQMLSAQVNADYPRITEMRVNGEGNQMNLPLQRM
jgi:hypothetical protein